MKRHDLTEWAMLPYTSIPILSAAFLIVIGVLIGHLLFYRYHDEPSNKSDTSNRGNTPKPPSTEMDLGLDLALNPQAGLEESLTQRESELSAIKAAHASLETQWHQLKSDHERLKADLTKANHVLSESKQELLVERQKNVELESMAAEGDEHAARSRQSAAALQTVRNEYQLKIESEQQKALDLGDQIRKRDVDLRRANERVALLEQQLAVSQSDSDEFQQSQLATMRQEVDAKLDAQIQQIEELTKAVQERDQQLAKSDAIVAQLQHELDTKAATTFTIEEAQAESSNKIAAAKDQQRAAEAKLAAATAALSEAKVDADELTAARRERDEAQSEVNLLKKKMDELTAANRDAESDATDAERQLEQLKSESAEQQEINRGLQAKVEQLSTTLQGERLRNEKLAQAEQERSKDLGKLQRDSDELVLLRESQQRMQATLEETQSKLKAAEAERDEAANSAASAQRQIEQLSTTIHRQHEDLQAYAHQSGGLSKQLGTLQTENADAEAQLAKLRSQVSANEAKEKESANKIADREAEVTRLMEEVDRLQSSLESDSKVDEEFKHRLASLTQQRDTALRRADATESDLRELRDARANNEAALRTIQTQFEMTSAQLKEQQSRTSAYEQETESQTQEIQHLRQQLSHFEQRANDHSEIAKRLSEVTARLELTTKQRDEAIMAEQSTREIISELRTELTERLEAVEALRHDKDEAVAKMTAERRAKNAVDRQLRQVSEETESELKSLRAQKEVNEQTIRNLRQQRADLLAAQKSKSKQKFMPLSMFKGLSSSVEGFDEPEKTRFDEQLGVLYKKRPARRDDLKLIAGIASVLERKLNKLGVYKYQQIMQWDDVAVEEFSKLLSFRDRIQRDNWIGQARRLYRENYERRVA